ncbi:transcriptional regulator [Escherichia coli]
MINQLTFTKHYDTFDNVSKIYSDKFPQGKDLDLLHIVLYFRFLSYQENNLNCYESHETLAKIFKSSASTIKRKINDLKEMGLLETSPHPDPYISSLIYNALPLTDAHITPPGESSLSDLSEAEEAQEQPKGHKQPSFDVLDDWDTPLPWETEETPVSSSEKLPNGIEAYFAKKHPKVYEDFDIPF